MPNQREGVYSKNEYGQEYKIGVVFVVPKCAISDDSCTLKGGSLLRRKAAARNRPVSLDLDEILESKSREKTIPTTIRLPASVAKRLMEIAKARKMTRAKLVRNLVLSLIREYEEKHGPPHR